MNNGFVSNILHADPEWETILNAAPRDRVGRHAAVVASLIQSLTASQGAYRVLTGCLQGAYRRVLTGCLQGAYRRVLTGCLQGAYRVVTIGEKCLDNNKTTTNYVEADF